MREKHTIYLCPQRGAGGPANDNANFAETSCSWTLETNVLQLVLSTTVPAETPQTVVVGTAAGITMPVTALTLNQPTLTIAYVDDDSEANNVIAACCVE